ncbi:MAG TPA: NAD(P)/FAD-dependent oxidoreductase [Roseiflexaceae bacterium]
MTSTLDHLPDGGRVVIIGGGPGAVACALALQRMASQMGQAVHITLLEGKQFAGDRHYNQCAGVLSPPVAQLLEEQLGVPFPHHLSRVRIPGYVLHAANEQIILEDKGEPAIALRRIQFDAYMLESAVQRGIQLIAARAVDLEFHADRVVVYTENAPVEADVVVGAFGLDAGSAAMFSRAVPYRPPQALSSVVTKYHPDPESIAAFGSYIHAFLPANRQIEFGAITPKGNHLAINIAGRAVDVNLMQAFLNDPVVRAVLPSLECAGRYDPNDLRFFKGYFPCSLARGYYGDRYVMVGDAAGLVRAFKGKGVTSAILTGIRAAHTILQVGISQAAFAHHYQVANDDIISDLPYGHGIRLLTMLLARSGLFRAVLRAARQEPIARSALFDAVSAHAPYRQVLVQMLHPRAVLATLRALAFACSSDP